MTGTSINVFPCTAVIIGRQLSSSLETILTVSECGIESMMAAQHQFGQHLYGSTLQHVNATMHVSFSDSSGVNCFLFLSKHSTFTQVIGYPVTMIQLVALKLLSHVGCVTFDSSMICLKLVTGTGVMIGALG